MVAVEAVADVAALASHRERAKAQLLGGKARPARRAGMHISTAWPPAGWACDGAEGHPRRGHLVRARRGQRLAEWVEQAERGAIAQIRSFAAKLHKDWDTVVASLRCAAV